MHLNNTSQKSYQSLCKKSFLFILSLIAMTWLTGNAIIGLLILGMIFFHEYGHIQAAKYVGIGNRGIYFLPFLGAVALINDIPVQRGMESFIALAGPAYGMVYSLILAIIAVVFSLPVIGTAAFLCALINLLNLMIPVNPLDGGRIVKNIAFSIHPLVGIWTMVLANVFALYLALNGLWIMYIVGFFGYIDMIHEIKHRNVRTNMHGFDIVYSILATIAISIILSITIFISMPEKQMPEKQIDAPQILQATR